MKEEIETKNVAKMARSENRQADEDLVITPEMIEAGAFLLCGFQTVTLDEGHWAEEVYRAMAAVAAKVKSPSTL